MSDTYVVSGSDTRGQQVAEALRAADCEVVLVEDAAQVGGALADRAEGSVAGYVQLPVSVSAEGPSVISRVRGFLQGGLLLRFDAAEAVLPSLADDARVVLVAGNTAVEGSTLPDDRAARLALLEVLAHAVRAAKAPVKVRVRVADHSPSAEQIAQMVLTGAAPVSRTVADLHERAADLSYEDWRAEVMGAATVEV